ncbi:MULTISPECIES: DUF4876 domain-containing protein [unclassified Chryseobacterium]|uniref:DUF4876 domain-containing protein n=1 Tax=unclassified Chryseobacterium TaxID=2593645 RepID=UPI00100B6D34|nr:MULTISPECIES: DUF4876 domain-containing protein [unclassified Chryseobacterium]RXM52720.1 DUF4876 domain-containing protein [Chryseobacterium sp. CH25]RXM66774.1 DUF4876 domain-containing protein [Chryseobacterium sp. CH1]
MKKRVLLLSLAAMMATTFTVTSCTSDDFGTTTTQKGVLTLNFSGENISTYKSLDIEIREVNTGTVIRESIKNVNTYSLPLDYGSYKITVNGAVISGNEEVSAGAMAQTDVALSATKLNIPIIIKKFHDDFIIEEVFFTGVKTVEGKNYNSSRYFKLTNNTKEVLYADKLIIGQSEFLTVEDKNPTPYNANLSFPVKAVMVLPGSGTQYPVQPGDFIVIADNAINHKAQTSTAYDLHNANFEYPSNNPALGQVDNPSVPNAKVIYSQMNFNMFFLHDRGFESYVIARFPFDENEESFLKKNTYEYTYINSAGGVTAKKAYSIPNSWIIDGVNNSISSKFAQTLTSASIDGGWTSVGTIDKDPTRFGKSVRRKVNGQMTNGRNLYLDTNNSSNDFVKDAQPSLKDGIVH